jgi:phosphatidylglycerol:prolipoprotein diacylglycerol transferase
MEGFLISVVLWWLYTRHRALTYPGFLAGIFFMLYAAARTVSEEFRYPVDGSVSVGTFSITLGQLYCIPIFLIGLSLFVKAKLAGDTAKH